MAISKDTIVTEVALKVASETQQQIGEYQKNINQLTQENRKLTSSMNDLAKQGKAGEEEYKNLQNQVKANKDTIDAVVNCFQNLLPLSVLISHCQAVAVPAGLR